MKKLALAVLFTCGLVAVSPPLALADAPPDVGTLIVPAFVDAGSAPAPSSASTPPAGGSDSGSAVGAPLAGTGSAAQPTTADKLPNPVDDPLAAIDTLKAQKKQGWAVTILGGICMLTAGFTRAAQKWPTSKVFAWFAKNKTAILIVSGLSLTAAAAFNAMALGGTWMAAAWAAAGAAFTMIHPGTPAPTAPAKTTT